ncbi:ATP-binding protein [Gemmatimonadota bacterium]
MIERRITSHLKGLFQKYPVVTITGPRQSGKTTLVRAAFPKLAYVSLENPDVREFANQDPRGFLRRYGDGAILDEIQRTPELLSYIQGHVDEQRANGLFVLTGSQQLEVSQAISQSLAGRTALLRLLPFSMSEAALLKSEQDTDTVLYTGFYPRIYDHDLNPTQALGDYFETYVQRDVRQISEIRNLAAFERFVRLCAGRVGQLLNLHSLGSDAGVAHTTAREWLSLLEASYIVFLLRPHHANVSKRLIKSPKLYFHDVGLASYLLGVEEKNQLFTHPLRGGLFENLVVIEALKHRYNRGLQSNLCFYRESTGHEVDLICKVGDRLLAVEIKAGQTVGSHMFAGLKRLQDLLPEQVAAQILVHGGDEEYVRQKVQVTNAAGLTKKLEALERKVKPKRGSRR